MSEIEKPVKDGVKPESLAQMTGLKQANRREAKTTRPVPSPRRAKTPHTQTSEAPCLALSGPKDQGGYTLTK